MWLYIFVTNFVYQILSLNIDPFYVNEEPLILKFRNIRTVTLQEDIFSKESSFQISVKFLASSCLL